MFQPLHTAQLDMLGFTTAYQSLFIVVVSLIMAAVVTVPCISYFIKLKYNAFLRYLFLGCLMSLIILVYDRYTGIVIAEEIWLKTMMIYSLLYAIILIIKSIRQKYTAP